jgi:GGDEF domain-containing protein
MHSRQWRREFAQALLLDILHRPGGCPLRGWPISDEISHAELHAPLPKWRIIMTHEQPNLESVIIKVSIGIGRNLAEAEQSIHVAKQRKDEHRYYNIELYQGRRIHEHHEEDNKAIRSYLRLEDKLRKQDDLEGLADLENLKIDPKTGLLNRTGYEIEVMKLRRAGEYHDRVIIFIDGDDMKRTNESLGYEETDRYLVSIGKALRGEIRTRNEPDKKARNVDVLLNRKNDSGGDEFIIDLHCDYAHAEHVARRYVRAIYRAQQELKK